MRARQISSLPVGKATPSVAAEDLHSWSALLANWRDSRTRSLLSRAPQRGSIDAPVRRKLGKHARASVGGPFAMPDTSAAEFATDSPCHRYSTRRRWQLGSRDFGTPPGLTRHPTVGTIKRRVYSPSHRNHVVSDPALCSLDDARNLGAPIRSQTPVRSHFCARADREDRRVHKSANSHRPPPRRLELVGVSSSTSNPEQQRIASNRSSAGLCHSRARAGQRREPAFLSALAHFVADIASSLVRLPTNATAEVFCYVAAPRF